MPTIRQATADDIAGIVAVVNAAFEVERDFRSGDRTAPADIARLLKSDTFFVAVEHDCVVGAVLVRVSGRTGYFGMLSVSPALQRAGIGRLLREAAENYCRERGCTEMTLSTGSFRQELLSYYRRFGYEITSVEPAPADSPFIKPIEFVKMSKAL